MIQILLATGNSSGASVALIDWSPYSGLAALSLSLIMFAVGSGVIWVGIKMKANVTPPITRKELQIVTVLVWALSILLVHQLFGQIARENGLSSLGFGPIFPITVSSAVCAFLIIAYISRGGGILAALGNGFAGAAAGPMVFELPFVLIITPAVTTRVPHPLFLFSVFLVAIVTTLALPTFSSRFSFNRYSLCFLGAMFLVFGAWALLTGYAPPSDPVSFSLNAVSKVLGFGAVVASFTQAPHARPTLAQT